MLDLTFLGASGGPIEAATCSILIKPAHLSYQEIILGNLADQILCIDAGSGIYLLAEIIYNEQQHGGSHSRTAILYGSQPQNIDRYVKSDLRQIPFADCTVPGPSVASSCPTPCPCDCKLDACASAKNGGASFSASPFALACQIFEQLGTYLITHPHLDHVLALAVNSAGFKALRPKRVIGSHRTVRALEDHIFNGTIWPRMGVLRILDLVGKDFWKSFLVNDNFSVTMFDLLHGKIHDRILKTWCGTLPPNSPAKDGLCQCVDLHQANGHLAGADEMSESAAFLLTYHGHQSQILIFGDFESDLVSKLNQNLRIWQHVAPLVVAGTLLAIVMECSSCLSPPGTELYGHLMPYHLILELNTLEAECVKISKLLAQRAQPLKNLNVIVNHIKESADGSFDPKNVIQQDLESLNEKYGLGVRFSIALGGITIRV